MRICNNKDGLPDCCGGCYKDGLCLSKCKCEDSLTVNEQLIKQLMYESGRHERIINKFKQMFDDLHNI
jgi:hypothetical protein